LVIITRIDHIVHRCKSKMKKAKVFNLPPGPFNQRLISPRGGEVKKTFYLQNNKWDLNVEYLAHG